MIPESARRQELNFLIACTSPKLRAGLPDTIELLVDGIEWESLGALAFYHRVRPLLFKRVLDRALAPDDVRAAWSSQLRANAVRNLRLTNELIAITRKFAAAEIPVLPHKGPLLAQAAYSDLAMRDFGDLDILVRTTDLPAAISLLVSCDFAPPDKLAWLSSKTLLRWTAEMSYTSPQGISVDLHWRLTPAHYTVQLDPELLWKSSRLVTIAGTQIPTLDPEALLVLLAVHGGKHCWEALGWLADLAWLVDSNPEINWQRIRDLAEEARCKRPVLLALSLMNRVFEITLPAMFVNEIAKDPAIPRIEERVLWRWYEGPLHSPRSPELLFFADALAHNRFESLRHFFGLIFHPTEEEWRTRRRPEWMFWLYTVERLARLTRKYSVNNSRDQCP
jgi:hypothetical protein